MNYVQFEKYLPMVEKPSRYIDHEINAIKRNPEDYPVRFCFAFPDVYELGVSHLGLKILYSIINSLPYAMADRCYLPWIDMIDVMRTNAIPLFALESNLSVLDFDVLGITLQSELTFTNVLELIDLAGISIEASARKATDPIVMAGGPCASNPLPLIPFIDVFFIGEAEEAIVEIAEVLKNFPDRNTRLQQLSTISSCYVPSIHGCPPEAGISIPARKYTKFHLSENKHEPQLLSWQLATHNRYVSEIMRGCSRGCRFCHAGYYYRPVRERDPQDIIRDLIAEIKHTGWDEAGLTSLSSSDYTCIRPLLKALLQMLDTQKTHVSLPSLRVDTIDDELIELMRQLGREGLTIAPEAGSQRLRNIINKNLSQDDILDGIHTALQLGWQKVKLYFMLGLPFETDQDIDETIELIQEIDRASNRKLQINITLSPFVPKPFTPFQWVGMASKDVLLQRIMKLKNAFSNKRYIKIKYHTIENSILESIITRGDIDTAQLIRSAWQKGAIYDAWNECFNFNYWTQAIEELGLSVPVLIADRSASETLPWSFIDTGVSPEFFLAEWDKSQNELTTLDCRQACSACGVCNPEVQTVSATQTPIDIIPLTLGKYVPAQNAIEYRYRVYYQKTGLLRFISHLDWMRMLFRLISILQLDVVYTQGFNPHPKVSLSPPLPLGVIGTCEYFDISFCTSWNCEDIFTQLNAFNIPDFRITLVERLNAREAKLQPTYEEIGIQNYTLYKDAILQGFSKLEDASELIFIKKREKGDKSYDLKQIIESVEIDADEIRLTKKLNSPALFELLAFLFAVPKAELYSLIVKRLKFIY